MNRLNLSAKELNELRTLHRWVKDKRGADRIKAIYLLGLGYTVEEAAEVLMVDEETLRNYVKRYQRRGLEGILSER